MNIRDRISIECSIVTSPFIPGPVGKALIGLSLNEHNSIKIGLRTDREMAIKFEKKELPLKQQKPTINSDTTVNLSKAKPMENSDTTVNLSQYNSNSLNNFFQKTFPGALNSHLETLSDGAAIIRANAHYVGFIGIAILIYRSLLLDKNVLDYKTKLPSNNETFCKIIIPNEWFEFENKTKFKWHYLMPTFLIQDDFLDKIYNENK